MWKSRLLCFTLSNSSVFLFFIWKMKTIRACFHSSHISQFNCSLGLSQKPHELNINAVSGRLPIDFNHPDLFNGKWNLTVTSILSPLATPLSPPAPLLLLLTLNKVMQSIKHHLAKRPPFILLCKAPDDHIHMCLVLGSPLFDFAYLVLVPHRINYCRFLIVDIW